MSQNPDRQHHFWFHKRNGDGGGGILQLVLNCGMLTGFTAAVMKSSLKAGIWLSHSRDNVLQEKTEMFSLLAPN